MEDSRKSKPKKTKESKPKPGKIPPRTQPKGSNTDPRNVRYPVRGSSVAINM